MTFAVFVDIVLVVWLLHRQLKVRRIWPRVNLRLAVILTLVGLVELVDYTGHHTLSPAVVGVLALSFAVGAVALGAVRAATVRIWRVEGAVLRQGTWLTVGLWILSLALHFGAQWWIDGLHGSSGVISASLLLWLGVTYGVQNAVVHHRAEGMLQAGAPIDARSEAVGGRWWGGTWGWSPGGGAGGPWGGRVGRDGGGGGGFNGGGGVDGDGSAGGGRARSHPDAIEAHAEPVEPPPRRKQSGATGRTTDASAPDPDRRADPGS